MNPSAAERRSAPRYCVALPVTVKSPDGSFDHQDALTRDVSANGIFFFMTARPAEGELIEFTVTLPPEVTLTDTLRAVCKGRVVRVEEHAPGDIGVGATIEGYNAFVRLSSRTN